MKFGKLFVLALVALASLTSAQRDPHVIKCQDAACTDVGGETCTAVQCLRMNSGNAYPNENACNAALNPQPPPGCSNPVCVREQDCAPKTCTCAKFVVKCKQAPCPDGCTGVQCCTPVECLDKKYTDEAACLDAAKKKVDDGDCKTATCENEMDCTSTFCNNCNDMTYMRTVLKECTPKEMVNGVPAEPVCKKKVKCEYVTKTACEAAKGDNPDDVTCSDEKCKGGCVPTAATPCIEWEECPKVYGWTEQSCCTTKCGPGNKYKKCVKLERDPTEDCAAITYPAFPTGGLCLTIAGGQPAIDNGAFCTAEQATMDVCTQAECNDKTCVKKEFGPCTKVGTMCKKEITECKDCDSTVKVVDPSCQVLPGPVPLGVETENTCIPPADCTLGAKEPCTPCLTYVYKRTVKEDCAKFSGVCKKKVWCEKVLESACVPSAVGAATVVTCSDVACDCDGAAPALTGDSAPATNDKCYEYKPCDDVFGFTKPSCCSTKCGDGSKYEKCVKLNRDPNTCEPKENPEFSDFPGRCADVIDFVREAEGTTPTCDAANKGKCVELDCNKDTPCKKKKFEGCKPVNSVNNQVTGNTGSTCENEFKCVDCDGSVSVTDLSCDVGPEPVFMAPVESDCIAGCMPGSVSCGPCDGGPSKACLLCKWEDCEGPDCCKNGINKKKCLCKKADNVTPGLKSLDTFKELPFAFCAALKIEGTEQACQRCGPCRADDCGWAGESIEGPKGPQAE